MLMNRNLGLPGTKRFRGYFVIAIIDCIKKNYALIGISPKRYKFDELEAMAPSIPLTLKDDVIR